MHQNNQINTSSCAIEILSSNELKRIQLMPASDFNTNDGRPAKLTNNQIQKWKINKEIANKLIADFNSKQNQTFVDYAHEHSKNPSFKSAGWFKKLEYIENEGIFAHVDWTEQASSEIKTKQYKYISPTFIWNRETGEITQILNAALTNNPAIDGMEQAQATKRYNSLFNNLGEIMNPNNNNNVGTGNSQVIENLTSQLSKKDTEISSLAKENESLKTQATVDKQAIEKLNAELVTIKSENEAKEKQALIEQASCAGQLPPAMHEWANSQTVEQLTAFLATQPKIVNNNQSAQIAELNNNKLELSEAQKLECEQLGISEAAYLESIKEERELARTKAELINKEVK